MVYARIENGTVINLEELKPGCAHLFPNAVRTNGRPVAVGDTYENGAFTRNGAPVLSELEQLRTYYHAMQEALSNESNP